jgi:hypothetical protein
MAVGRHAQHTMATKCRSIRKPYHSLQTAACGHRRRICFVRAWAVLQHEYLEKVMATMVSMEAWWPQERKLKELQVGRERCLAWHHMPCHALRCDAMRCDAMPCRVRLVGPFARSPRRLRSFGARRVPRHHGGSVGSHGT